jgi:hypothetical protein
MKAFTIDSDNNITVYTTRKAATDAQTGVVFTGEDNIAARIGADNNRLVAIYNSLTGVTPVKKFTSSKVACRRIFAELAKLEAPAADAAIATDDAATAAHDAPKAKAAKTARDANKKATKRPAKAKAVRDGSEPATSKKAQVLALISRKNGATLDEIMTVTGWQKHTVRGFISILGKNGVTVESSRSEAGDRTYKAA